MAHIVKFITQPSTLAHAEIMDAGRAALLARGINQVGPYQSPMEDGMQHFHEWYRRVIQFSDI